MSFLSSSAFSQDLFRLDATDFSGGGAVMDNIGTDNLFGDVFGDSAEFQLFDNSRSVSYTLRYAGISDFLRYEVQPDGPGVRALVSSGEAGLSETFLGSTREDVDDQLEEYLLGGAWSELLAASQRLSLVAVTDGNPGATTALMANQSFDSAFDAGSPAAEARSQRPTGFGVSILADVRSFKAGDFEGKSYSLPLNFHVPIGKYQGHLRVPLGYTEIGDAKAYHAGVNLTVPIEVYSDDRSVWTLSPSIGTALSFSEEFLAGTALWSAGVTSTYRRDFGAFYVTIGNHLSFYEGIDIEVEDYEVGGDLSQQILKNGVKVSVPLGGGGWEVEGYVIHTAFLSDAAVEDYLTPGLQLTKVVGESGRLSVRLEGDFGDDYESVGVRFGGGFKF